MIKEDYANPHSIHRLGLEANKRIHLAEEVLKDHINGKHGKIIWTSSGSMANYWALHDKEFSCSIYEHKSILDLPNRREDDVYRPAWYANLLVNNETGEIYDVAKSKSFVDNLHVDAVQALGKTKIDVEELQCDTLSLSAHKIGGPKGIGALWIKDKAKVNIPYLGTPSVQNIIGFAEAVKLIDLRAEIPWKWNQEHSFLEVLKSLLRENQEIFLNSPSDRVPGILNISFLGVDKDELQLLLSDRGVMVSTGAACGEGDSHVLKAMELEDDLIKSAIRISFGPCNGREERTKAAEIIAETSKELKG
jgi:cysteine desulfurase